MTLVPSLVIQELSLAKYLKRNGQASKEKTPSIFRYVAIPVDTLFKGDQVNNIRVIKPLFPRGETESLIRHDDCLEKSVMMLIFIQKDPNVCR